MHPLLVKARKAGWSRRDFLRNLFFSAGSVPLASTLTACGGNPQNLGSGSVFTPLRSKFADIGPLLEPNADGLRLPAGFTSRVVAVSGEPPIAANPAYLWHAIPDGGGVLALPDGGWIYVSNSEVRDSSTAGGGLKPPRSLQAGGAGALRFSADGTLVDAYAILTNTTTNCSGCITPWGTWLSGEEVTDGLVYECDPLGGNLMGTARPALGLFGHEAIAIDVSRRTLYLTEDVGGNDRFYRFLCSETDWPVGAPRPALEDGRLQAMGILDPDGIEAALRGPTPVAWFDVLNPDQPQRNNYRPETTVFSGNEGVWFFEDFVYFSTKNDDRIWAYDVLGQTVEAIYDRETSPMPILSGVDNITMTSTGDILVAEDGGDMKLVVILPDRSLLPLVQAPGDSSGELCGPAFSPDGRRLYVSSQRNGRNGAPGPGITYEITLPFAV
jgi:uncharacterized protein